MDVRFASRGLRKAGRLLDRSWVQLTAVAVAAAVGAAVAGGAGGGSGHVRSTVTAPGGLVVHSTIGASGDTAATGRTVAAAGLNEPVVGGAATPSGGGWWEVAADGGIFSFGDAAFHGSTGALHLNQPIVGMASTPSGDGYWLVARDGGIFTFGDAVFYGSTGAIALNQPIVGMAATPSGLGYWLVARDGGIFSFGDAAFHGSTGAVHLNQPIVGMASTPSGLGYWLVASDGGIFGFGDARFFGSAGGAPLPAPVAGVTATAAGDGYWITTGGGQVLSYGDAPAVQTGSPSAAVVGAARAGRGLRLLIADGSSLGAGAGVSSTPPAAPAAAAVAPAGNSTSYSWLVNDGDGSPARWNPCAPVHYVSNLAEAPAGAAAIVAGAFARVSAATGISFVDDGATTEVPSSSREPVQSRYGSGWAPVVVAWARPGESDLLPGGSVIGEGGSSWVEPGGSSSKMYVTGEVVIDPDNTANLAASFGSGSTLGELLMHEIGHVIGLGHTSDPNQIMYPTLLPLSSASYGAGDLTGLAQLGRAAGCLTTPAP